MNQQERFVKFRPSNGFYVPYYDKLCAEMALVPSQDGSYWAPVYGDRTWDEQNALFATGRTVNPTAPKVTNAQAGESPHNYNCASDWDLFDVHGNVIWEHNRWGEYSAAVAKVGLKWGGNFQSKDGKPLRDKPHNELVINCSWKSLRNVVLSQGSAKAMELIKAALPPQAP